MWLLAFYSSFVLHGKRGSKSKMICRVSECSLLCHCELLFNLLSSPQKSPIVIWNK